MRHPLLDQFLADELMRRLMQVQVDRLLTPVEKLVIERFLLKVIGDLRRAPVPVTEAPPLLK